MITEIEDSPAAMIARLDDALSRRGQDVILRTGNTSVGQAAARARVRGYKPSEVIGIIQQGDSKVVVSASSLTTFGVPTTTGYVVIDGLPRRIISVVPIRPGGTLVRVDLQVRG
jgi:hypothetical protein